MTLLYLLPIYMTESIDIGAIPTVKVDGGDFFVSDFSIFFLQVLNFYLIYNLTISMTPSENNDDNFKETHFFLFVLFLF